MKVPDDQLPDENGDRAFRAETLSKIALGVGIVALALVPLMYLSAPKALEIWTAVLIAALSFLVMILIRTGRTRYTAHLMGFGVLLIATFGVYSFGSVRSASAFIFAACVAGVGSLLGFRALLASVLLSTIALGTLTWAELHHLLPQATMGVGLKVWLTQSTCILVVATMVYFSRLRSRKAWQDQNEEIERRKATELERDRSLERFARFFRTSPSPMLAQSARDGSILDVNPAFERCYGYTRQEVLGRQEEFLWAEPQAREAYLKKLFSQRLVMQYPVLGLRSDGSHFDVLVSSEMSDDSDDKLIITTISDISVQTEALEKLRRSEERFSKAFHFSPMHMSITRYADGKVINLNKVAQGVQADGFQGAPSIAREYWPSAESRADFVRTLRHHGRLHGYETQLCRPDGSLVEVRIWAELIDLEGEACVLACTMNVTEEKRRQALLENMARGMSAQAGESLFMALVKHMSHALAADTVYVAEIGTQLQMRSLAVWRAGEQAPNFTEHLDALPQGTGGEAAPASYELSPTPAQAFRQAIAPSRQQIRSDWPLLDSQGQVIGMLSAQWKQAVPLTPESQALMSIFASRANAELLRHRQEQEVRHLNATLEDRVRVRTAELEQVNAELDAFAYSVSHDLKSPLRAIDGFAHLMLEQFEDRSTEAERDAMQRILAATHRMSNLIKDLLALARISQSALDMKEVDLSDMAHSIVRQVSRSMPDRPRDVRIAPSIVCRCDEGLARIALTNLLHNALKYTRDQPHPVIELGQVRSAQGEVEFFVRDNGAGFDMVHADKLFKPFQRLHMPSAGFEGTGIGLATVRRIIERHGGLIHCEAAKDQGAIFTFSFGPQAAGRPDGTPHAVEAME
jgi:PAS domain S-box-containing protein